MSISVGADQVVLQKDFHDVVEKKVRLPARWLQGFVKVQAVQCRMELVHQVDAIHAYRFLRSTPRMATHRRATWVVKAGSGLRISQVESAGAVRVGGLARLRVLESLARDANSLSVFSDPETDASAWVLEFSDCRFLLVISPEVWRGFSGEGQALQSLAVLDERAIPQVRALLKWQSVVDRDRLAEAASYPPATIDGALKALGARGLVGFDLMEGAYFHREMPFDLSLVERLQPRLLAARKLIEKEQIRIGTRSECSIEAFVQSGDVEHRVVLNAGPTTSWKCTCPWFAKHGNSRGPCKHVLAVQIVSGELEPETA